MKLKENIMEHLTCPDMTSDMTWQHKFTSPHLTWHDMTWITRGDELWHEEKTTWHDTIRLNMTWLCHDLTWHDATWLVVTWRKKRPDMTWCDLTLQSYVLPWRGMKWHYVARVTIRNYAKNRRWKASTLYSTKYKNNVCSSSTVERLTKTRENNGPRPSVQSWTSF